MRPKLKTGCILFPNFFLSKLNASILFILFSQYDRGEGSWDPCLQETLHKNLLWGLGRRRTPLLQTQDENLPGFLRYCRFRLQYSCQRRSRSGLDTKYFKSRGWGLLFKIRIFWKSFFDNIHLIFIIYSGDIRYILLCS